MQISISFSECLLENIPQQSIINSLISTTAICVQPPINTAFSLFYHKMQLICNYGRNASKDSYKMKVWWSDEVLSESYFKEFDCNVVIKGNACNFQQLRMIKNLILITDISQLSDILSMKPSQINTRAQQQQILIKSELTYLQSKAQKQLQQIVSKYKEHAYHRQLTLFLKFMHFNVTSYMKIIRNCFNIWRIEQNKINIQKIEQVMQRQYFEIRSKRVLSQCFYEWKMICGNKCNNNV